MIEELRERDWNLGGEQSGHIIWTDFTPTGDGIAAALLTCRALGGRKLADVEPFERLPQKPRERADRRPRRGRGRARRSGTRSSEENAKLEGRGRVLVRPSGTEPLLRVMVEAPTRTSAIRSLGRLVRRSVERELGLAA